MVLSEYRAVSKDIDLWTFVHFFFGLVFAGVDASYPLTFAAAVLFEAIEEDWLKQDLQVFGSAPVIETRFNQILDISAMMFGRFVGGEVLAAEDIDISDILFEELQDPTAVENIELAAAIDPELLQFPIPIPVCCLF